jgi:hypothetical protein
MKVIQNNVEDAVPAVKVRDTKSSKKIIMDTAPAVTG